MADRSPARSRVPTRDTAASRPGRRYRGRLGGRRAMLGPRGHRLDRRSGPRRRSRCRLGRHVAFCRRRTGLAQELPDQRDLGGRQPGGIVGYDRRLGDRGLEGSRDGCRFERRCDRCRFLGCRCGRRCFGRRGGLRFGFPLGLRAQRPVLHDPGTKPQRGKLNSDCGYENPQRRTFHSKNGVRRRGRCFLARFAGRYRATKSAVEDSTLQRSIIAPAERVTNLRWGIALILGFGVLIDYIDRGALSVASKPLHDELGLGPEQFGVLSSAFFAVYAFSQIPIGYVLDRYGVTLVSRIGAFLWSIAAACTAIAPNFATIYAARLFLGLAEAPTFPATRKQSATGSRAPNADLRPHSSTLPQNFRTRSASHLRRICSCCSVGAECFGRPPR